MKKFSLLFLSLLTVVFVFGQPTGYYNNTDGKNGDDLKAALHNIIKDHTPYSYFFSKEIFKLSDADPNNSDNVILVYTGRSNANDDYGTSGDQINREHVWAKSHGDFTDWLPMYSDVHNLKPADASVNQSRSNKDFDNGGTQHPEATGCYFTDSTWEARDEVKGDVARIIFYMATRYEGENGEIDLEVVDHNNTYPLAQHGKLSTLLEWNLQDPPDEFERNRNNVIYSFQKNRNPFIDNPEFAQLIWGGDIASPISIDNIEIAPQVAVAGNPVNIQATITNNASRAITANLYWGLSFESLTNEIPMSANSDVFSTDIPGQAEDVTVYYKIVATDGINTKESVVYNFYVPKIFVGTITSIYNIQGQQDNSPYDGEVVSTTGVVTGNFGGYYYIQDGTGGWNGLFVYESGRNPSVGDSIVITGTISEYYGKTELSGISDYYFISSNNTLPDPVLISTGNIDEAYEGVLVKVTNAVCTDANYQGNFYMWTVDDGSGELRIHNTSVFEYEPVEGSYYNVTGPMNYDFDEWKIDLRFESDVSSGGDTDGPTVVEVTPVISTNIKVMFNEAVETTSAEDPANYSINNGIAVESAMQHSFNKSQVNLTVSELSGNYELTVQNVEDISGNVMEPQTIPFSFVGIEEFPVEGQVKVYPNPSTGGVNISFASTQEFDFDITITDVSGRQLLNNNHHAEMGLNNLNINLSQFDRGVYFLNLVGAKGALNYKLIVR